jgi:hypothetical protein
LASTTIAAAGRDEQRSEGAARAVRKLLNRIPGKPDISGATQEPTQAT